MRKRRLSDFTILELLIVVAIMVILSALLFPALSSAKAKSKRINCMSNLKNIGVAAHLYTSDNQGYIPLSGTDPLLNSDVTFIDANQSNTTFVYTWHAQLWEYLNNPHVYRCSVDPIFRNNRYTASFAINVGANTNDDGTPAGATYPRMANGKTNQIAQIKKPSECCFFTHRKSTDVLELYRNYNEVSLWNVIAQSSYFFIHGNGMNVYFVDGHCSFKKIFDLQSTASWYGP